MLWCYEIRRKISHQRMCDIPNTSVNNNDGHALLVNSETKISKLYYIIFIYFE